MFPAGVGFAVSSAKEIVEPLLQGQKKTIREKNWLENERQKGACEKAENDPFHQFPTLCAGRADAPHLTEALSRAYAS